MYQCLKISEVKKNNRSYYLSTFFDLDRANIFKVYTTSYPSFDVGCSYDLKFAPSVKSINFLQDET